MERHRIAGAMALGGEVNIHVEESSLGCTMDLHVEVESGPHDTADHHAG